MVDLESEIYYRNLWTTAWTQSADKKSLFKPAIDRLCNIGPLKNITFCWIFIKNQSILSECFIYVKIIIKQCLRSQWLIFKVKFGIQTCECLLVQSQLSWNIFSFIKWFKAKSFLQLESIFFRMYKACIIIEKCIWK